MYAYVVNPRPLSFFGIYIDCVNLKSMASKTVEIEPIQFENKIRADQRFAKRNKVEYHVYSTEVEDASLVEKWVGVHQPFRVLMDPASYAKLKDNRIKWVFDNDNILIGCNIVTQ